MADFRLVFIIWCIRVNTCETGNDKREGDYTLLYAQQLLEELVDVLTRPRIRDK